MQLGLVHYLPLITTAVAIGFVSILWKHWGKKRDARYLLWWTVGVGLYGVGTLGSHVPADIPFTVRSIVEMGRHPHRHDPALTKADDRRAVEEAMLRTGVGELAERVYATLSSGERLRVFLARVLAQEAPIVLLDEPTANLDVGHSETVLAEAKALSRASHTVVSVFHDLNAAAFYCDRICLLAEGKVRATGSVREVLRGDVLSDVYRQKMEVVDHPFRDCPLVLVVDQVDRPVPSP